MKSRLIHKAHGFNKIAKVIAFDNAITLTLPAWQFFQLATMQQVVTQEKGLAKGQANKIDYNAVTGIVTLTGNAKLVQTGASFAGNVIRYSLKAGDVEATAGGSQRVELVFPPNSGSNRSSIR